MKSNLCKSILLGSMMLLPAVQPALANFSFVTSQTSGLPATISLQNAPLGNGGNGGGLYSVGGVTFYLGGSPTGQGVVTGAAGGQYAPPILVPGSSPTQQNYLSTGVGTDLVTFSAPQKEFSLLWGSVDNYNTLNFFDSAHPSNTSVPSAPVYSLTGTQVLPPANGNQGSSGSTYVEVMGGEFNQVEFVSTQPSFEATNFESTPTPEPGFIGVLTVGLAVLAFAAYRRERKAPVL